MSDQVNASRPMYRPSRDDHGIDRGLMRALFIVGGIAAVGITGYAAFRFMHHGGGGLPVVQADTRPIRVKPDNPGGMAVAAEEKPAVPGESSLAPPTEEPNRALMAGGNIARPPGPMAPPLMQPHPRTFLVQLTAVKSEADARAAWDKLAKQAPGLIADKRPLFLKTAEPGPTPWRLRTGGFADPAHAKSFCDQVKAKGGTCAVVDS
jgi:cell division septation protein DedD